MRVQVAPDRGEFIGKSLDAVNGGHVISPVERTLA